MTCAVGADLPRDIALAGVDAYDASMTKPNRPQQSVRIILADDHQVARSALRAALDESGFEIVAEASDGEEVLRLATELRPDIVIMDLNMPRLSGIEATRRLAVSELGIKIVVLTMYAEKPFVAAMIDAGARGYVVKSDSAVELIEAIRTVASNRIYISASVGPMSEKGARPVAGLHTLTPRERQVLSLLGEGKKASDIAQQLLITTSVVLAHRLNIMRKLALRDDASLIRYAIANGLVQADSPSRRAKPRLA